MCKDLIVFQILVCMEVSALKDGIDFIVIAQEPLLLEQHVAKVFSFIIYIYRIFDKKISCMHINLRAHNRFVSIFLPYYYCPFEPRYLFPR